MCSWTELLRVHRARWPLAEEQDLIKLLYQGEFGCGHMLADEAGAHALLETEWRQVREEKAALFLEDIGGGFVRLHLAGLKDLESAWRAFHETARRQYGSMEGFREKLRLLPETDSLRAYMAAGCPALHHSEAYRNAYRPAYRVLERRFFREK